MEKNLKCLGVFGIISLLSYTAMVVFSPLAYPGYDWLSMAVSDLCAEGAPSEALASQLNALFGPCALVSVMIDEEVDISDDIYLDKVEILKIELDSCKGKQFCFPLFLCLGKFAH